MNWSRTCNLGMLQSNYSTRFRRVVARVVCLNGQVTFHPPKSDHPARRFLALLFILIAVAGGCGTPSETQDELGLATTSPPPSAVDETTTTSVASAVEQESAVAADSSSTTTIPEEPAIPQPDIPGVLFVSTSGTDTPGGGRFADDPLRTPAFAVSQAVSGDIIEIDSGTYAPLEIVDMEGLELRSAPGADARFTSDSYIEGAGLRIINSREIDVNGLTFERLLWGVQVQASQEISLSNNVVRDIGQEAISISDESAGVQIVSNIIELTGRREGSDGRFEYRTFGEGIYLGTGSTSADGSVDVVRDVLIDRNIIRQTTAEAIDVKASVEGVEITNNVIGDIDLASGGAIAIGRGTREYNADVTIANNAIYNITTWGPYTDGIGIRVSSTARIFGNAIWDATHRGILVDEEFRSVDGEGVDISTNLVFATGIADIEVRPNELVSVCGTVADPAVLDFDPGSLDLESIELLINRLGELTGC